MKDIGIEVAIRVHSDASAAIGIARRRGLGKLRHLDCEDLWIQHKIRSQEVDLVKVLGTSNPADALTKHLDRKAMEAALRRMNVSEESGRPSSAPAATKA